MARCDIDLKHRSTFYVFVTHRNVRDIPYITIGQYPSPHFTSFILRSCRLHRSIVSMLSPSWIFFVDEEWPQDNNFMCIFNFFEFIVDSFLHCLLVPKHRVNEKSENGPFLRSHLPVPFKLTNFFLTLELFWSPDRNDPMRAAVSDRPRIQWLSIKLIDSRIFPIS